MTLPPRFWARFALLPQFEVILFSRTSGVCYQVVMLLRSLPFRLLLSNKDSSTEYRPGDESCL
jgi:hypothetical protein